jgi:hypothetical protein
MGRALMQMPLCMCACWPPCMRLSSSAMPTLYALWLWLDGAAGVDKTSGNPHEDTTAQWQHMLWQLHPLHVPDAASVLPQPVVAAWAVASVACLAGKQPIDRHELKPTLCLHSLWSCAAQRHQAGVP